MIFETERFVVNLNLDVDGYEVVNNNTGVVEFETKMSAEAMRVAVMFTATINDLLSDSPSLAGLSTPTGAIN